MQRPQLELMYIQPLSNNSLKKDSKETKSFYFHFKEEKTKTMHPKSHFRVTVRA